MENCYKMYTWFCRTLVAIMLEMFWKMQQITDYFSKTKSEDKCKLPPLASNLAPLTKEHKHRRHIRSMSDVQRSTPLHMIPVNSFRRISQPLLCDSDSKNRRLRLRNRYEFGSSDSSDPPERKTRTLERNVKRHKASTDSMRYL